MSPSELFTYNFPYKCFSEDKVRSELRLLPRVVHRNHYAEENQEFLRVNGNLRQRERSKDLRKSFVDAFCYISRRTKMDIDKKMKELAELFSKTGKELNEIVRKNEEFISEEVQRVQEAIRETSEVCWKEQMDRLRDVKGIYEKRIKICNDKAASGLRAAKTKYDQQIQTAETLGGAMKRILRECLETNEFVKCVASRTKEAVKRRKQITESLSETLKNAELSAVEQLREATKCHSEAQVEILRSLQQILKETKDCLL